VFTDVVIGFPQVPDLTHQEQNILDRLIHQYKWKMGRNLLRSRYYDSLNVLKDYEISIPPQMKQFETVVGWPAKAVDSLSRRCKLDGFVVPNLDTESLGIDDMWADNRMEIEAPQAHTSALIHSCAFIATTLGDVSMGEPEILITARSALSATALWNPRTRRLDAALSIISYRQQLATDLIKTDLIMYLPDQVIQVYTDERGMWQVERTSHSLGRVPVEVLVYKPRLDRWAGSSRISRAVMSITDEAVRTVLRAEVSAEFFSSPQRYILGADPDAFEGVDGRVRTGWEAIMGQMLAMSRDEEGNLPVVGQFAQQSMEPHFAHLRSAATRFAGETNLPVGSLGIVQDNPSSAEAIDAAKEELINEAEDADTVFGYAWASAVRTGLQLRENRMDMPREWRKLTAKWRDPKTPSKSSAADAVLKTVQAFPWMAESPTALEQLGWDQTTIARALAEKAKMPPVPAAPVAVPVTKPVTK
jgi:hypothetical protein